LAAEQHKLAEDRAEGTRVIASEIGDGLKIGFQMSQQPDHFDVAMGLGFEPAARPHAIQIAVDIKLQSYAAPESSRAGFSHGLQDFCNGRVGSKAAEDAQT